VLVAAATAAANAGVTGSGGGGGGEAAATSAGAAGIADITDVDAAFADELKRLRKALKRSGSGHYAAGPLPALAQLALLPANLLQSPPQRQRAPVQEGGGGSGADKTMAAPPGQGEVAGEGWAAVELARVLHRCVGWFPWLAGAVPASRRCLQPRTLRVMLNPAE
jgi:hypothetical protein